MANFLRAPCDDVGIATSASVIPKKCEKWVLIATILASSMAFIDGTIVNVALPALQTAMHASVSQIQWVVEAYALTLGTLLLVGGALGDIYGRRIIFLIGVLLFAAASAYCGFAPTIEQLIIARAIQGIGAALLVPGSLALISASFPEESRGQAIGTWAGFTAITSAVGPLVGGWLVQHISWRWIFFLNLPLALIVCITTILYVAESKNVHQSRRLDMAGTLLAIIGFGAIVFGFIEWGHNNVIAILIIGICALIGFFLVETYTKSPMVSLKMFQSRNFSGANLITFFLYSALYGVLFFFPLHLIQVQNYTATQAGAALLPLILLLFLLSRWAGGLVKRYGSQLPLIIGPTIAGIGFALLLRANINGSYWNIIFPATVVLGIGMGISVAPLTTVVMNSIDQDHAGAASGINNAVSRIAGLLAVAIFGLIMTTTFNQRLEKGLNASAIPTTIKQEIIQQRTQLANIKTNDEHIRLIVQESFIAGYKVIVWIGVVLCLLSAITAAIFIHGKASSGREIMNDQL